MRALENYTLVIPTFNRPLLLGALLRYLESARAAFPILILDSSSEENRRRNRAMLAALQLNAKLLEFDEQVNVFAKFNEGLAKVETDYVSVCADDDLVFVDAIAASVGTLVDRPDYVACHGIYMNFSVVGRVVDLQIEYAGPSIEATDAGDRIYELLSRYEALFYAVYRRDFFADVLRRSKQPQAPPLWHFWLWELFAAVLTAGSGKVKRLACISNARRAFPDASNSQWHPASLIVDDSDAFFAEFVRYRRRLIDYFSEKGVNLGTDPARRLTLAHLAYFVDAFKDGSFIRGRVAEQFPAVAAARGSSVSSPRDETMPFGAVGRAVLKGLRRLRQNMAASKTKSFRAAAGAVEFRAPAALHHMMTPEVVDELSAYCQNLIAPAV